MRRLRACVLLAMVGTAAHASDTLRRGNGAEPETLDPHRARSVAAFNVIRDLHEGLVTRGPDGRLQPGAAERWDVSRDGRTWTFHLRDGLRWSSGEALTAHDFERSLRRALDPATRAPLSHLLEPIENATAVRQGRASPLQLGVQALDDRRLVLRLQHPATHLLELLTLPAAAPVHPQGESAPRSNGAYRLAEWRPQSHLVLERNRHYWNDADTRYERVVYYPTDDRAAELKRYRAGEIDWTDGIPVGQVRWIRERLPGELQVAPYLGVYYYGFNLTREPFRDQPGLRRALAMVVDRERLAERILATGEAPAAGFVPPGVADYTPQRPAWADWPAEQRLGEARRLYTQAGYSAGRPLEVELRFNSGDNHRRVALVVASMWREALGVRTRLVNEEYRVFLQNRRHRTVTQVFRADWIADYNDALSFASRMQSGVLNDTGWVNARYDARVADAAGESDPARRRALLEDAERILMDDLPVLPLYFYASKRLVKPHVTGWQPNVLDQHLSRYLRPVAPLAAAP